jgi:hypothetical protein
MINNVYLSMTSLICMHGQIYMSVVYLRLLACTPAGPTLTARVYKNVLQSELSLAD